MNERIKAVRTSLGLSRQAFGERLGCSGDVINNAERGRSAITDMFIRHLCLVFDVNESWLRSGEGEMFNNRSEQETPAPCESKTNAMPEDAPKRRVDRILAQLDPKDWETIDKLIMIIKEV